VTMAAASLGWDVKLLDGLGNVELKKLLGLEIFPEFEIPSRPVKGKFPEIEFEHPDCLLLVFPSGIGKQFDVNYKELSSAISEFSNLEWKGNPNLLSKQHVCWDIIYRTAEVVKKPLTIGDSFAIDPFKSSGFVVKVLIKILRLGKLLGSAEARWIWMELLQFQEIRFIRYCYIAFLRVVEVKGSKGDSWHCRSGLFLGMPRCMLFCLFIG
jgi:hypothetical protein